MKTQKLESVSECKDVLFGIIDGKESSEPSVTYSVSDTLFGRVKRYKDESHQETLHCTGLKQQYVFVFGPDFLENCMKKDPSKFSAKAMMLELGITEENIETRIKENWKFELILFQQNELMSACPATWEGVEALFKQEGELLHGLYKKYYEELISTKYEDFPGSKDFFTIYINGRSDPRYIDKEKMIDMIKKNEPTISDLRLYLYLELHLKELYDGKGFTIDAVTGKKGFKEFFVRNVMRKDIPNDSWVAIPLDIK